jgi:hypothetical protein
MTTHHYTSKKLVDRKVLKIGTGFFYHNLSSHQLFLITNRHVIINEHEDYYPNVMRIKLHTNPSDLTQNSDYDIDLYDGGKKLWIESKQVCADVVAIRLERSQLTQRHFIIIYFASNNLLPTNMLLYVAEDVFVMGYPKGIYDEIHNLPIIRNGIISSAYPVYFNKNPYFLVDSNLEEGTSGSPVMTKFRYIRRTSGGGIVFSGPSFYL